MSVDVRRMVETMGVSLMAGQVFSFEADYQQKSAFSLGTLLLFVGQEWDRSVEMLVDDNRALRELFARAAPDVGDATLRERVQQAAEGRDPGLRVSALLEANNALRGLLIDLHVHVEERDDEAAAALERAIWRELVASTDRRMLPGAPF